MEHPIMTVFSIILQVFSLSIGTYYLFIAVFGFIPKRESAEEVFDKYNKFALIISAHNEEMVIGHMVDSLKKLDYPSDFYDIFVIADNCTDRTAEVAEEAGAIVYKRFNQEKRGKGHALEWMFAKLYAMEKQYDYISIFDADNLVSSNYLKAMNAQANKGYKVVQGYIDSKNPYDSWITSSYSFSFWCVNRIFQLPRYRLGLCCQLSGTGFIIAVDTLKKLGWGATCLTEDMEFTMKLALNDEKVAWAQDAVIYDEKPLTLIQSWRQRKRWMQGHMDVATRFFTKLVKKAVNDKDWTALDCAIYLVQPVRVLAMAVILFMSWAQTFYPDGNLGFIQMSYLFKSPVVWNVVVALQFLYTPFVLAFERKEFNRKMFISYLAYIVYQFTWIPITIQGMIDRKKTEWAHTVHTRQITIAEFEKNK
ncbi:MAG: glycosyltransferase [Clostridia bacterium]|nr:glycosyltransferase [Clostridia bacterium]